MDDRLSHIIYEEPLSRFEGRVRYAGKDAWMVAYASTFCDVIFCRTHSHSEAVAGLPLPLDPGECLLLRANISPAGATVTEYVIARYEDLEFPDDEGGG